MTLFYTTFTDVNEHCDFTITFPKGHHVFADFLPWFSYSPTCGTVTRTQRSDKKVSKQSAHRVQSGNVAYALLLSVVCDVAVSSVGASLDKLCSSLS